MTISTHNSFSTVNLEYFKFSAISEGLAPSKESVCLDNGLKFNLYPILSSAKDFSFNKKTGIFLTNFYPISSVYESPVAPFSTVFTEINSPITNIQGFVIAPSSNLSITTRTDALVSDVLKFTKIYDYLYVTNPDSFYLTYNPNNGTLSFGLKIIPDSALQKFEYILNDNGIILFPYGYNLEKVVVATNPLSINSYNSQTFYSNISSYYLGLYSVDNISFKNIPSDSFISKYDNNPIENLDPLKNNIEVRNNTENYNQNHVIVYPYEHRVDGAYPIYSHGLKNYQTPEYDYSNASQNYTSNSWVRREYDQIFTGTNQYEGSENVFLGYRGKTQKTIFYKDKLNDFFYPLTAPRISIHDSGLVEDGARAGEIPFESDRLYINKIDYAEFLPSQPTVSSVLRFDGTWACSWLSGNSLGDGVWLDRYYNSAYYTLDQALSAETKVYNPKMINIDTNVRDELSQTYLESGVRYSYYRVGNQTFADYVSAYDFSFNDVQGSKLLHIDKWDSNPLKDVSPYKNDGILFYNSDDNLKTTHLVLDGSNHSLFSTDEKLLNTSKFTASLWVNVDDWTNIRGEQIFGNYYNSGYGLINSSALTAPTFTISENVGGNFHTLNYRLLKINTVNITNITAQENRIIQKLPNFDYWVFDCVNIIGRKYDVEGKFLAITDNTIIKTHITKIDQVEIDSAQNLYLSDTSTKKIVQISPNGVLLNVYAFVGSSFQIDIDDQLIGCYGEYSAVDSNNTVWEIVGGNLYKDRKIYGNIGSIQQISFDAFDNLWILHGQDTISKLNTVTNLFEFSLRIGPRSSLAEDPCILATLPKVYRTIDFLKTPDANNSDVAVIIDTFDNEAYILTRTGKMISKLNLKSFVSDANFQFYAQGDFTGYQYLRKYGSTNKSLSWKFKIAKSTDQSPEYHSLSYSTDNLYKGWHMFSFVFDSSTGSAEYYIDSILVDSVNFAKGIYNIKFDYKSALLLGASNIKNKVLNDVIGIQNGYKFIGSVSDLRIYSKSLTNNQLRAIYHISPFSYKIDNLYWNIPTGERNFIECVNQWYKMQITGSKSKFFNIKIHNLPIDDSLKPIIENSIKNVVRKIIPSYADLNQILWE